MANHFRFPVFNPDIGSSRVTQTYASVTESILRRIRGWGIQKIQDKAVCPPEGHFEIIFYKGVDRGRDDTEEENGPKGSVRLWFSYPNVYVEAFKANGVWRRFNNMHPEIVPPGAPPHRYQVEELPFEAGYHSRGLNADWDALRFGTTTIFDIYKVLKAYPNNPGGILELRVVLTKTTALFSEALRFAKLREALIYQMKFMEGSSICRFSGYFNKWEVLCNAIRRGPEFFVPIFGLKTFPELLSVVTLLLHQG
ncbi:hypothetical protein HU200_037075 [Digitaria exilis]|uniref:rRNA N-glycosylase n=1 Tax=Digitaria exilis TaxID=1010633 RepID=A0A835BEY7_9POAL|nr:hypothetical protein HU200_037075 [Digitaria exilis]CAB3478084.1 unnamed protein product [Digitaria exilis]